MLTELVNFEEEITLISNTGVQFLDFGLTVNPRREMPGEFVVQESNCSLARLEYDEDHDRHVHPAAPGTAVKSTLTVPVDESIKLLQGVWLPVPVLKQNKSGSFAEGPTTWARARLVELAEGEDPDNHTHRVTLAFDTNVFESSDDTKYLAPTRANVQTGDNFGFACRATEIGWFIELPWVVGWITEVFNDLVIERLRLDPVDVSGELGKFSQFGHYLNLLALIGGKTRIPDIKLLSNKREDNKNPIQVDMVLDVGNSRTCGILVEDHPKESDGLRWRYELELRDLTHPQLLYTEPFESRVEFAEAAFGKHDWACQSGRADSFLWPTVARVGREAMHLASRRRGTEGATGLSSPKRYLWDDEKFDTGWRFNTAFARSHQETPAIAAPFTNLVNDTGAALYELPDEERIPVFTPQYSRSAMMMFMLAEVLTQTLSQINSAAQRLKMPNSNFPRHLRSIILTVPPGMPKPERQIFEARMRQALGLVWKAFGWHAEDDPIDEEETTRDTWPPFPRIEVQWDEATSGQIVYLFSEIQNNFSGRPDEFFEVIRRPRVQQRERTLTIGSIDIGGGTTDLVINDYQLDQGQGSNVWIVPEQRFRDGFKVAGDDILLEVVQAVVVPALKQALQEHGVGDPESLLSRLIGSDPVSVEDSVLRQQFALQVMYPAGLFILKEYEQYNPVTGADPVWYTLQELLAGVEQLTEKVLRYFSDGVRRESAPGSEEFGLLDVKVQLDLRRLHELFISDRIEVCRAIKSLCEIVYLHDCDMLLLTGRPSRLPGVQALVRALLPLPPDRIIGMHGYKTGTWYPFNRQGRIDDPKTTAAVGAMLCVLGQGRLMNFFFRSNVFKPYSTVKYMGLMADNIVKDADLYYSNVDLDNEAYELPETMFEMRGVMQLGFRQLSAERWGASPLYTLDFADEAIRRMVYEKGEFLRIELKMKKERGSSTEQFIVARVETQGGQTKTPGVVKLRLNTLSNVALGEGNYWLDSGSVFRV